MIHVTEQNSAPVKPWDLNKNDPALYGTTYLSSLTFINYDVTSCNGETNYALINHPGGDDAQHPIISQNIQFLNTPINNILFLYR